MQLSDLLGAVVTEQSGQRLGTVTDVRLSVRDDTTAPTLFGLIISPRTRSSYLGYERSQVRRPAALAALLRWRHRGTFLALWRDLHVIDDSGIVLRDGFDRYSAVLKENATT
ncbi:MAG: PRC-barrel domain containing protein [Mycolicibacterium neoaurum]|uniref:PRC-barrel domain containing protein n=1 Tax=Mycolicibacterium neoaurum TaxID=1795 RepID=UPI002FF7265D